MTTSTTHTENKTLNLRRGAVALAMGLALIAGPTLTPNATLAPQAQAASQDIVSSSEATKNKWRQDLLNQVNKYRATKGLYPLKYSSTITKIAQAESDRAVRDENYNHSMRFLSDKRAGQWNDAGEITALSYRISTTDLMNFWKNSKNHNKVLLSKSIDVIGIGMTQVDGSLTHKKEPWRLVGVIDGFSYASGKQPSDTRTSVKSLSATATSQYQVKGGIATKYRSTGGAATYGNPTGNERSDGKGGAYQEFAKGSSRHTIYWTKQYGTHVIKTSGAIGQKWKQSGGRNGLGVPTSSETSIRGGGVYQTFKNGNTSYKVMWKSGIGAKTINETGAIGKKWKAAGYERGYGFPLTDEVKTSPKSVYQKFQKGTLTWRGGPSAYWSK